jgi:hypothetical protein
MYEISRAEIQHNPCCDLTYPDSQLKYFKT